MIDGLAFLHSDEAPAPNGHYSQATAYGGLVFVSTQLPTVPGMAALPPTPADQAIQAIANVRAILNVHGGDLHHVLSATMFVTDIACWPEVDRAFASSFGEHRPARGVTVTPSLHLGAFVAMAAIAADPRGLAREFEQRAKWTS